jgi:hypothetical protein
MPKRLPYLLTSLAVLLICCCFIATKAPSTTQQYDYIAVTQIDEQLEISSTTSKFEIVKFKKDSKGYDDNFTALLNKITELQGQGYEVVQNNVYTASSSYIPHNYMLLRRPKP